MAKPSPRPPLAGPPLLRPLARLSGLALPTESPSLPARLGVWVDWNRAVDLQRALDGRVPAAPESVTQLPTADLTNQLSAARAEATQAIDRLRADLEATDGTTLDWALLTRRYQAIQRNLFATSGRLRGLLRDQLALRGGEPARLAAVDAVLEQTLAPRAISLFSRFPQLLVAAQEAAEEKMDGGADALPATDSIDARIDATTTCNDIHALLRAELDVHFLPLEGLLAALRA